MTIDRRLLVGLIAIVAIKLIFQALYLPAWEGPDEPFHLGRVMATEETGMFPSVISRSVAAHPCADDLRRVFDCQAFDGRGAFNVLDSNPSLADTAPDVANYEAHQPPTYYLLARGVLSIFGTTDPISALRTVRLLSVAIVIFGLVLLARVDVTATIVLSLFLMLPGAAEALVRASNDALVFGAAAVLLFALDRRIIWLAIITIAIAPTIKLTAAPFVAAAVILFWMNGERKHAIIAAAASALVIPLQAFRGWAWGGTVEMNQARLAFDESSGESVIGLLRSLYTVAKTTLWLGNWSFFIAPLWLILLACVFVIVVLVRSRLSGSRADRVSFVGGLVVFAAGITIFAIAHRSLFGQWGGVGGWYVWGIAPWLALGLTRSLTLSKDFSRVALAATIAFILLINVFWFRAATELYGFT